MQGAGYIYQKTRYGRCTTPISGYKNIKTAAYSRFLVDMNWMAQKQNSLNVYYLSLPRYPGKLVAMTSDRFCLLFGRLLYPFNQIQSQI